MSCREDIIVAEAEPLTGDGGLHRRMVLLSLGSLHRSILQMADGRWLVDSQAYDWDLRGPYRVVVTEAEAIEAAKDLLVVSDAKLRLGARWA